MEYHEAQPKQNGRSLKLRLILSAIILLMLALGFNALLSLNSLEKLYVASMASQYSAIGRDLQRNIEKSLKFGKSLEKFIGIEKILDDAKQNILQSMSEQFSTEHFFTSIAGDISVSIALPDGKILYSTNQELVNTVLPEQARPNYAAIDSKVSDAYSEYQATYIVPLPIRDGKKVWVGSGIITFSEGQIKSLLVSVQKKSIRLILAVLAASTLLLLLLFSLFSIQALGQGTFPKRKVSIIMLFVIGTAQLVFSASNTNDFRLYYLDINRAKIRTMTTLLKEDIEFYFTKGIRINKLIKMEVALGEIISSLPELDHIVIIDQQNKPLYMANKECAVNLQILPGGEAEQLLKELVAETNPEYSIRLELMNQNNVEGFISANAQKEGYISTNLSQEVIREKLLEIGLDSATILLISMLFFGELLILIFHYIEQRLAGNDQKTVHYGVIRPAAFLFYFGLNVSVSFLPLYMEDLYQPLFGLSKEMISGLPISMEMFLAGIGVFIAGIWFDRRGWHEPFLSGVLVTAIGFFYSWLAPDALHFIAARGLTGLGYGFTMMAAQGFVIAATTQHTKAQGLTRLTAGSYAGYICGSATGAMLAQRIGYQPVFLFGAITTILSLFYVLFFMRSAIRLSSSLSVEHRARTVSMLQVLKFLFQRNIFCLSALIVFPTALLTVGFLYYLLPIYLDRLGVSESDIGRLLMLHGIFFIYIAPFVSKYIDLSKNKKIYIVLSGIIGSLAFAIFYFSGGLLAASMSVILLGISGSLNASSAYALQQHASQVLGGGKTLSILATVDRSGQVFGPMVFSWLLVSTEITQGITYVAGVFLAAIVIFQLLAQRVKGMSASVETNEA